MKYLKLIIILILLFPLSVSAEFYKYVDGDGNVHFTDDINQVPEDQRKMIPSYVESESPADKKNQEPSGDTLTTVEESQDEEGETSEASAADLFEDEDKKESFEDKRARIEDMKKGLESEYQAIMKQKNKLEEEKEKIESREDILKYNKKVENLNLRSEKYEQLGIDYQKQVENYNASVAEQNAKVKQKPKPSE